MKFFTTRISQEFDAEALAKAREELATPPSETVENVEETLNSNQPAEKIEEEQD
jgi:hypothetical protein